MPRKKTSVPLTTSNSPAKQAAEDDAKTRLLWAALEVFAKSGFEATTTRMLASKAGVNLSAIPYYFGSKEGLYHAVIQMLTDRIRAHMQAGIAEAEALLAKDSVSRREVLELLGKMLPGPIILFTGPYADFIGPIVANEQQQPTSAFPILYDGYIRIVHELGTRLVARYLGIAADSPEAVIRTHALAGQMFIFLGARATILRRLGENVISEQNVKLIQRVIAEQSQATLLGLDLILSQKKEENS